MIQWVKVFAGRFEYATKWEPIILAGGEVIRSDVSVCYVDILRRAGGKVLVVSSEIGDNPGASTTDSAPELVNALVQRFQLEPRKTTFAERYARDSYRRLYVQDEEHLWIWSVGWSGYHAKTVSRRFITRKMLGLE